jgi:hypothetical protein
MTAESKGQQDGPQNEHFRWKESDFLSSTNVKPLTPDLNPSAQRCLTRFLLGILLLGPRISLIYV